MLPSEERRQMWVVLRSLHCERTAGDDPAIAVDRDHLAVHDVEFAGTADGRPIEPAGDHRGVARTSAARGHERLSGEDTWKVGGRGRRSHEDHALTGCVPRLCALARERGGPDGGAG